MLELKPTSGPAPVPQPQLSRGSTAASRSPSCVFVEPLGPPLPFLARCRQLSLGCRALRNLAYSARLDENTFRSLIAKINSAYSGNDQQGATRTPQLAHMENKVCSVTRTLPQKWSIQTSCKTQQRPVNYLHTISEFRHQSTTRIITV